MSFFRVILHGEGVYIQHDSQSASLLGIEERTLDDDAPIVGFYATRLVRGTDKANAMRAAVSLIVDEWSRPPLREINRGAAPRLTVETVEKIGLIAYLSARPSKGFTFYAGNRSSEDIVH